MLEELYNFQQLSDTLWSSGMPTEEQLREVARAGVQVVLNLATPDTARDPADEAGIVRAQGMEYIHLPVEWDAPRTEDLESFTRAMDARQGQRLLVHCRANYRASAFIALYRVRNLGWSREQAFAHVAKIWNPDEYPIWKKFIEDNLPSGR